MPAVQDPQHQATAHQQAQVVNWIDRAQQTRSHVDYARGILQAMGAPITDVNTYFLVAWMDREGTSAAWNPLATTVSSGQGGETNFNTIGVKNFPNAAAGIAAWVKTIHDGYYPTILQGIMSGNPLNSIGASNEWKSYTGGGNYAQGIAQGVSKYLHDPSLATGTVGNNTNNSASGTGATTDASAGVLSQWGWLINDPEVGPLIRSAENPNGGMTQDEFTAALQKTNWFRDHASGVRTWLELQNTDPATARAELAQQQVSVQSKATELGITLDPATLNALATQAQEFGWTDQQITMGIFGADNVTKQLAGAGGGFGASVVNARQLAATYGLTLSDATADNYAKQQAEGLIDTNTLSGTFAKQAQALFPSVADQIGQGHTVSDLLSPYMQAAAQQLGSDPSQMETTDPKWLAPLQARDSAGKPAAAPMSLSDWNAKVLTDPTYGWDHTTNALDQVENLTTSLATTFGKVG